MKTSHRMSADLEGFANWLRGWTSPHLFPCLWSCTSGRLPKEKEQIQLGKRQAHGGNPEVNLTLYIWRPVECLKNNRSWTAVSTCRERAAGCNISSPSVLSLCGIFLIIPFFLWKHQPIPAGLQSRQSPSMIDSAQGQIISPGVLWCTPWGRRPTSAKRQYVLAPSNRSKFTILLLDLRHKLTSILVLLAQLMYLFVELTIL